MSPSKTILLGTVHQSHDKEIPYIFKSNDHLMHHHPYTSLPSPQPQNSMTNSTPTPSLPLAGRVAIVTGASRGIGHEIASHLSSLGALLVLGYASNPSLAQTLASKLNSNHPNTLRAITARVDVSNPDDVKSLFDLAESTFRTAAHILVNSAAINDDKYPTLSSSSVHDFDSIFAVNARGAFVCLREASNRLVRGGGGRIVVLSSSLVAALRPGYGVYTASKAAVEAMTKIAAKELKGTGITVNCVAPGPVATDMFFRGKTEEMVAEVVGENPMGRLGEVGDIAPVVGFLATDAAGWINGQVIRVNGGFVS